MIRLTLAAVALSALLLLPACDDRNPGEDEAPGRHSGVVHFDRGDGSIGMDGDKVVIAAGGTQDRAIIGPDGSLTIGGTAIDTSAAGQSALKAYDAAAVAMKTHAIAIGRTGAAFGVDVLKDVVRGFFDGQQMDAVGQRAGEGAQSLVASLRDLCARMDSVLAAQQAAAAAVPAFQPYAVLDAEQVSDCFEEVDEQVRDAGAAASPPSPAAAPEAPGAT